MPSRSTPALPLPFLPRLLIGVYRVLSHRAGTCLLLAGAALLIVSPFALGGGVLHPETCAFLPHYLSGQPLLKIVFDPSHTDWNLYQGRELSYLFDYLDCQSIALGVDHHRPHFLSACHYAFSGLTAWLMWWFARNRARLPTLVSALLVLLFLSTPAVFWGGSYFRSAKIGVAAAMLACACCVSAAFATKPGDNAPFPWRAWIGCALAVLTMGLFDKQGLFFVLLLSGVLAVHFGIARNRSNFLWWLATLLPLGVLEVYSRWISPALIHHFNDYWPDMAFQRVPWSRLIHERPILCDTAFYSPQILLDNVRFLTGDLPLALAGMLVAVWVWWLGPAWPWPDEVTARWSATTRRLAGRIMAALLPLALLVMNTAMILKFKAMVGLDFRRLYYGLPTITFVWIFVALAVAAILRGRRISRFHLNALLGLLVVCNLAALPDHRHIIRQGSFKAFYLSSPALLDDLRHLEPAADAPPFRPTLIDIKTPEAIVLRFFRSRQPSGESH